MFAGQERRQIIERFDVRDAISRDHQFVPWTKRVEPRLRCEPALSPAEEIDHARIIGGRNA